jgi:hypothetical protein
MSIQTSSERVRARCPRAGVEPLEPRCLPSTASSFTLDPAHINPITSKTDTHGNVIVLGTFNGIVDFDPRPRSAYFVHGDPDTTSPNYFVAKFAPSGKPLWVVRHGHEFANVPSDLTLEALATDHADNVYVSGVLGGGANFDADPNRKRVFSVSPPTNLNAAFLWKLTPDGQLGYAVVQAAPPVRGFSLNGVEFADELAVDPNGDAYLISFYEVNVSGAIKGVLLRFDSAGRVRWGVALTELPSGLALDKDGAPAVADDPQDKPIHLVRFSAKGRFISDLTLVDVKDNGFPVGLDPAPYALASLAFDPDNNALICGTLKEPTDFDPGPGTLILSSRNPDRYTTYLAKYTPAGRPVFATAIGGGDGDLMAAGAAIDRDGIIHFAGECDGQVDLDPGSEHAFNVDTGSAAKRNLILARYGQQGQFLSADTLGLLGHVGYHPLGFAFVQEPPSPIASLLAVPQSDPGTYPQPLTAFFELLS